MKNYMSRLPTVFDGRVNESLIHNDNDDSIQTIVEDVFRSLEINPHIKILDFKFKPYIDENYNKYINRKKVKSDKDIRSILPNRYGLITITIKIDYEETISSKVGKASSVRKVDIFDKHLLIPIPDNNGVFLINGTYSRIVYQMVDKTMYITRNAIVIKSIMPIIFYRNKYQVKAISNEEYVFPLIEFVLFKRLYPVILIYLCDNPMFLFDFLEVSMIMRITRISEYTPNHKFNEKVFMLSNTLYLCVHEKFLSSEYHYVQSIVAMLLEVTSKNTTYEQFYDKIYWISMFEDNDIQKGISIFNTIERMLDNTTKRKLMIDDCYKTSIKHLSKWVLLNYHQLRAHNNLDTKNKRLRAMEALFTELNTKLSYSLTKISKAGSKAKFDDYKAIFNFQSNYIKSCIERSKLLRYDQSVNDMNFMTFYKFTRKGPNALGSTGSRTITDSYRDINTSMIGNIDIISSSKSDPGQSGYIIPFIKMDNMMFDNSLEPNSGALTLAKQIHNELNKNNEYVLGIAFNTPEEYNEQINKINNYCDFVNSLVSYHDEPMESHGVDDLIFLNDLELTRLYEDDKFSGMSIANVTNDVAQFMRNGGRYV